MRHALAILALGVLTACSEPRDIAYLKAFVRDSDKGLPRRIDPLPQFPAKGAQAKYTAASLPDPFKPRDAAIHGAPRR